MPKVTQQASGDACVGGREGREGVLGQWLEEGEVHIPTMRAGLTLPFPTGTQPSQPEEPEVEAGPARPVEPEAGYGGGCTEMSGPVTARMLSGTQNQY